MTRIRKDHLQTWLPSLVQSESSPDDSQVGLFCESKAITGGLSGELSGFSDPVRNVITNASTDYKKKGEQYKQTIRGGLSRLVRIIAIPVLLFSLVSFGFPFFIFTKRVADMQHSFKWNFGLAFVVLIARHNLVTVTFLLFFREMISAWTISSAIPLPQYAPQAWV